MASPRGRPDPGIKPASLMTPTLAGGFFTTSTAWEALKVWFLNFRNKSYSGWLCWVFVALCRLSLVAGREGYSSLWCRGSHCGGFSCGAQALECAGFSSCGTQAQLPQGSNPCPPHWHADSYPLCHWASPTQDIFKAVWTLFLLHLKITQLSSLEKEMEKKQNGCLRKPYKQL